MSEEKHVVFDAADLVWDQAAGVVQYMVIYGPQPRWWWCRYLPRGWRWAWPDRLIGYSDMREQP